MSIYHTFKLGQPYSHLEFPMLLSKWMFPKNVNLSLKTFRIVTKTEHNTSGLVIIFIIYQLYYLQREHFPYHDGQRNK
jgi:hypothetical protein